MQAVKEDTVTTKRVGNPLGAYLNAVYRGKEAMSQHGDFFKSDEHMDRLDEVAAIIKNFFDQLPDYYTPRGLGLRRPFESVKVSDIGRKINRASREDKQKRLYGPLDAMGNVTYKVTNGHFIIRVYPK